MRFSAPVTRKISASFGAIGLNSALKRKKYPREFGHFCGVMLFSMRISADKRRY